MNTTRTTQGRSPNSRRSPPGRPGKGRRYAVTTIGGVPDDLAAIVSRAHAAALAMANLVPSPPERAPEPGPKEESGDEEQPS